MIYGNIEDILKYRSMSKWFAIAADFIKNTDLAGLDYGKTTICGDHVFINVMEADTKDPQDTQFEVHKNYWDVQIDIEGIETVQIALEQGKTTEEYKPEKDIGFVHCESYISCVMGPGRFIVCMEGEPHKPTLCYKKTSRIKKCVVKVEVEAI